MTANLGLFELSNSNLVPKKRMFPAAEFMQVSKERDAYASEAYGTAAATGEQWGATIALPQDRQLLAELRADADNRLKDINSDPQQMWTKVQEARMLAMRQQQASAVISGRVQEHQKVMEEIRKKPPAGWSDQDIDAYEQYAIKSQQASSVNERGQVIGMYERKATVARPDYVMLTNRIMASAGITQHTRATRNRGISGIETYYKQAGKILSAQQVEAIMLAGLEADAGVQAWRSYNRDLYTTQYNGLSMEAINNSPELTREVDVPKYDDSGNVVVKKVKKKDGKRTVEVEEIVTQKMPYWKVIATQYAAQTGTIPTPGQIAGLHLASKVNNQEESNAIKFAVTKFPYEESTIESGTKFPTSQEMGLTAQSLETVAPSISVVSGAVNLTGNNATIGEQKKEAAENLEAANKEYAVANQSGDPQSIRIAEEKRAAALNRINEISSAENALAITVLNEAINDAAISGIDAMTVRQVADMLSKGESENTAIAAAARDNNITQDAVKNLIKKVTIKFKGAKHGTKLVRNPQGFSMPITDYNFSKGLQSAVESRRTGIDQSLVNIMIPSTDSGMNQFNKLFRDILSVHGNNFKMYDMAKPREPKAGELSYKLITEYASEYASSGGSMYVARAGDQLIITFPAHTTGGKRKEQKAFAITLPTGGATNLMDEMANSMIRDAQAIKNKADAQLAEVSKFPGQQRGQALYDAATRNMQTYLQQVRSANYIKGIGNGAEALKLTPNQKPVQVSQHTSLEAAQMGWSIGLRNYTGQKTGAKDIKQSYYYLVDANGQDVKEWVKELDGRWVQKPVVMTSVQNSLGQQIDRILQSYAQYAAENKQQ